MFLESGNAAVTNTSLHPFGQTHSQSATKLCELFNPAGPRHLKFRSGWHLLGKTP